MVKIWPLKTKLWVFCCNGGDDGGRFWKAGEFTVSVTDYLYFEKSPVGLYVDASFVVVPRAGFISGSEGNV